MKEIIMFQRSAGSHEGCLEILSALGLTEKDFYLLRDHNLVLKEVVPGQRQLFISGSIPYFQGVEPIRTLAERARKMNPELVCISFASTPLEGPFDLQIMKGRSESYRELAEAVKAFGEGKLNRSDQGQH